MQRKIIRPFVTEILWKPYTDPQLQIGFIFQTKSLDIFRFHNNLCFSERNKKKKIFILLNHFLLYWKKSEKKSTTNVWINQHFQDKKKHFFLFLHKNLYIDLDTHYMCREAILVSTQNILMEKKDK